MNEQSVAKEFSEHMIWKKTGDAVYPYHLLSDNDIDYKVRVNDFPEEPFYTLIKENRALMSFNDWPSNWAREI